jgi:two-component system nitrogen regulation sensor histidine kinase NtrY
MNQNSGFKSISPLDPLERRKRKREAIAIILMIGLFIGLLFLEIRLSKMSSTLPFVNSIFFFGLLNINVVLLIGLVWLVFRNLGKLFIERRRKVLGAKLKTKLVVSFLAFSIIPTLVLFVISALYINSSFDKWFSLKVQNTLESSLEVSRIYYQGAEQNAGHFARHLSEALSQRMDGASSNLPSFLEQQRKLLALDSVEFYDHPLDERQISIVEGLGWDVEIPHLPLDVLSTSFEGETSALIQHLGTGDLIRYVAPVLQKLKSPNSGRSSVRGVVVVSKYVPISLVSKVDEISSVIHDYRDINPLKYPIKTAYLVILIMITLVILFVAIWIGLFLAKELTGPVERLVYGAQAVGAGNLDVNIQSAGHDEIAVLVESFNKMTRDLRENRVKLTRANQDLENRKIQLEAVLANIGTGVLVVDREGTVTTFNRALGALLQVDPTDGIGRRYSQVLSQDHSALIQVITRSLSRDPTAMRDDRPEVAQWSAQVGGATIFLTAMGAPLLDSSSQGADLWGAVIVVDDMTSLMKSQREVAWREVARRIAHEIKNPLTPIKLSAQRLQRRLGQELAGKDAQLLRECTEIIVKHTDELKEMVNEFSEFARFPETSLSPANLNEIAREAIQLYQQAHPEFEFITEFEKKLPIFEFDRDQIKRVMINLLDNAIAAIRSAPTDCPKRITIRTHYHHELQLAILEVRDEGPGMSEEVRSRVFEPYFTTKEKGHGLGLAIAKRIVNDHDGVIRVVSQEGHGSQFSLELPTSPKRKVERS